MSRLDDTTTILAIRMADAADAGAVTRLAALDSASVPEGPMLLGLLDGCPLVALALDSGAVLADPFAPTADLVTLVRERAQRFSTPTAPPARSWWRRMALHPAAGRA